MSKSPQTIHQLVTALAKQKSGHPSYFGKTCDSGRVTVRCVKKSGPKKSKSGAQSEYFRALLGMPGVSSPAKKKAASTLKIKTPKHKSTPKRKSPSKRKRSSPVKLRESALARNKERLRFITEELAKLPFHGEHKKSKKSKSPKKGASRR